MTLRNRGEPAGFSRVAAQGHGSSDAPRESKGSRAVKAILEAKDG
jgi:hypothetical protein